MNEPVTRCLGLVTQQNSLTLAPGALTKADNCVIDREDILEDRRGYASYGTVGSNVSQLFVYSSKVLALNGTQAVYDNGSGTFAGYTGSYNPPSGQKLRSVEANSNCYITTDQGVQVLMDLAGTKARLAGAPRALGPVYALNAGATGFLASGSQCAYRVVYQRVDQNLNVLQGYPSTRLVVYNTAGTSKNVDLTCYIPTEITAADVVQVYRTVQVTGTSSDESGDDMGLVYQANPTSTDISNGYIAFTDSVVDALRGDALYTNPTQEGIAQGNERPPLCKEMALYRSLYMMYANASTPQRQFFDVVGATALGSTISGDTHSNTTVDNLSSTANLYAGMTVTGSGIPANTTISTVDSSTQVTLSQAATATAAGVSLTFITQHTIKIAGTTYTFAATEDATTGKIAVGLTGIAASDIESTARSMEHVVNRYATNTTVYAYYISAVGDLPGKLMLQERGVGAAAYTVQVSNAAIATMFASDSGTAPVAPATSTSFTSSNQVQKNAVYFSKTQELESVPAVNYIPVGSANGNVLRVVPLKTSAVIIKDEGVYLWTGDSPSNFLASPLDLTVKCKALDSVAVLNNRVYMISNQGVVAISETGVEIVSHDIEPDMKLLTSYSNLSSYTCGVAYENDRKYLMSTMSASTDTAPTVTWVYNYLTRRWTKWTFGFSSAVVEDSANKLYFSKGSTVIYRERKDFADTDYADPETAITITAVNTVKNTVTFTISGATPAAGWVISQAGTGIAIDSIVTNASSYTATMQSTIPGAWAAGAANVFPNVGMAFEYHNFTGGNARLLKQVRGVALLADNVSGNNSATSVIFTFRSNFDESEDDISKNLPGGGWGASWGSIPWGGTGDSYGYPMWTPAGKQFCTRLLVGAKHRNAQERLVVAGIDYDFEVVSEVSGT